jgi:hypothetical protein
VARRRRPRPFITGLLLLALAGCGGSSSPPVSTGPNGWPMPSDEEATRRLELYIATDIQMRAVEAGLRDVVTVHSVTCKKRDRIRFVCRIRSSSDYGEGVDVNVADAMYDPRTENASYDIRP